MFDPALTISSLLEMVLGIVDTTLTAFLLPVMQLVVYPMAAVLQWLSGVAPA